MYKKFFLIFIIAVALFSFALVFYLTDPSFNTESLKKTLTVDNLESFDSISSPLEITGQAEGFWFSEGTFMISVFNSNGDLLAHEPAIAENSDPESISFRAVLEFSDPGTEEGNIVFKPSDISLFKETEVEIPIIFRAFQEGEGIENMEAVARSWIEENSLTFCWDGTDLFLLESREVECEGFEFCYEYEYSFDSLHAGYGARREQILTQVITPHKLIVSVAGGRVVKAVTDGIFDEMTGEFTEE